MGFSALWTPVSAFLEHSCPTQYCCPVSRPLWPSRGRLRRFAPAAMQASSCSSVRAALYFLEAVASRVRQYRCVGVRRSLGLTQRRRHCLLPGSTYHTQSPQRPLLMAGSRHFPEGAQKGQRRHRPLRAKPRVVKPCRRSGCCSVRAFMNRRSSFVTTGQQSWCLVALRRARWSQAWRLNFACYFTTKAARLQPSFAGQMVVSAAFLRRSAPARIEHSRAPNPKERRVSRVYFQNCHHRFRRGGFLHSSKRLEITAAILS